MSWLLLQMLSLIILAKVAEGCGTWHFIFSAGSFVAPARRQNYQRRMKIRAMHESSCGLSPSCWHAGKHAGYPPRRRSQPCCCVTARGGASRKCWPYSTADGLLSTSAVAAASPIRVAARSRAAASSGGRRGGSP